MSRIVAHVNQQTQEIEGRNYQFRVRTG